MKQYLPSGRELADVDIRRAFRDIAFDVLRRVETYPAAADDPGEIGDYAWNDDGTTLAVHNETEWRFFVSTNNPNGDLDTNTVTASYTVAAKDQVLFCSGTLTVTLPTASGRKGKVYEIKNVGTGTVTIDGNSAETIDDELTQILQANDNLSIISDDSNWQTIR